MSSRRSFMRILCLVAVLGAASSFSFAPINPNPNLLGTTKHDFRKGSSLVTNGNHYWKNNLNPRQHSTQRKMLEALDMPTMVESIQSTSSCSSSSSIFLGDLSLSLSAPSLSLDISRDEAEALAGPFFGLSLFPYLAFLYWLNVPENDTPKGVTVGFATCLLFVFLTIPAAIAAQVLYGVSLADSDWLHGSAESLLTITNLVTVVAFRQALAWKEQEITMAGGGNGSANANTNANAGTAMIPASVTSYDPMVKLVGGLTGLAAITALVPALLSPEVHTPYLGGFLDLPKDWITFGNPEPDNALTVGCWIIHVSSLVEFLVAMGFAWRWADIVNNPRWKGLTWGLIPLHSSGITACTYHLFYNQIAILVPLQAFLTCVGNTTAAYATYRIAISNGWTVPDSIAGYLEKVGKVPFLQEQQGEDGNTNANSNAKNNVMAKESGSREEESSSSLIGFEDLGDALSEDNDYSFLIKLFLGCGLASYVLKYGELLFDFPFDASISLGFAFIVIPSCLNAFKWYKRSQDPTFEGWF